jgi:hypothetical protein
MQYLDCQLILAHWGFRMGSNEAKPTWLDCGADGGDGAAGHELVRVRIGRHVGSSSGGVEP